MSKSGALPIARVLILPLVVIAGLLAGFVGIAIVAGYAQPPSEWIQILHLDECELPCWIGITPGETTMEEAQSLVETHFTVATTFDVVRSVFRDGNAEYNVGLRGVDDRFSVLLFSPKDQAPITRIFLQIGDSTVTVGSLYPLLDHPDSVDILPQANEVMRTSITFDDGFEIVSLRYECQRRLPQQVIGTFEIYGLGQGRFGGQPWRGFHYRYSGC